MSGMAQLCRWMHAGIMVDGPKDMKPLVEAFAKQVCLGGCAGPCYREWPKAVRLLTLTAAEEVSRQ